MRSIYLLYIILIVFLINVHLQQQSNVELKEK